MKVDKKVLIGPSSYGEIDPAPLNLLKKSGIKIVENPFKRKLTKSELMDLLPGVDGLIAGLETLDREVLVNSDLKVISRCGSGMSNVHLSTAEVLGISVFNTPMGPTLAVAELTVGSLISLIRKIPQANSALHRGQWKKEFGRQLKDMTVLIIGFGRIGGMVGELLGKLGVRVVFFDPDFNGEHDCTRADDLFEALHCADVITLHCSGDATVLGSEEFEHMKDGVFVLNAARGGVLDEVVLQHALDSGKVAGAWLDTFETEPYKGPLTQYDQVIMTPHIGSYTIEGRRYMEMETAQNLLLGFQKLGEACNRVIRNR